MHFSLSPSHYSDGTFTTLRTDYSLTIPLLWSSYIRGCRDSGHKHGHRSIGMKVAPGNFPPVPGGRVPRLTWGGAWAVVAAVGTSSASGRSRHGVA